jgi:hypothetical protein
MAGVFAECTHACPVGTRRVTVGTRARIVGATVIPTVSVRLQITEPREGTEFRAGEECDVPTATLHRFWKTTTV